MSTVLDFKTPIYDDIAIDGDWISNYGVHVAGTDGIELSILPSKGMKTVEVMGMHGVSFISSTYGQREMPLPMLIDDIDLFDTFKKLIMSTEPRWISFKNTDIKIKGMFSEKVIVKPYGRKGTFSLTLIAPDPYFYEAFQTPVVLLNPTATQFYNYGNDTSFPIYEITGKGVVILGVNGQTMTLNFDAVNYETLKLDSKTCEIIKGTTENRLFSSEDMDFPIFISGYNSIAITGDCTNLTITPNCRWI